MENERHEDRRVVEDERGEVIRGGKAVDEGVAPPPLPSTGSPCLARSLQPPRRRRRTTTHEPTISYHPRTSTTLHFRLRHPHRPLTARAPPPPLPRLLPLSATTTPC
ncbi:hypothetical protein CPC08DRAFT_713521 [Agrocybe pediades]|nr:hypothetical protein CPC08DRAFT_713521 [Agrocybe pediades]